MQQKGFFGGVYTRCSYQKCTWFKQSSQVFILVLQKYIVHVVLPWAWQMWRQAQNISTQVSYITANGLILASNMVVSMLQITMNKLIATSSYSHSHNDYEKIKNPISFMVFQAHYLEAQYRGYLQIHSREVVSYNPSIAR